jgi:hypothetical protein
MPAVAATALSVAICLRHYIHFYRLPGRPCLGVAVLVWWLWCGVWFFIMSLSYLRKTFLHIIISLSDGYAHAFIMAIRLLFFVVFFLACLIVRSMMKWVDFGSLVYI